MYLLREIRVFCAENKIVMSRHSIEIAFCMIRKMTEVIFSTFHAFPLWLLYLVKKVSLQSYFITRNILFFSL